MILAEGKPWFLNLKKRGCFKWSEDVSLILRLQTH